MKLETDEYICSRKVMNVIIVFGDDKYDEICELWYHRGVTDERKRQFEQFMGEGRIVDAEPEEYLFMYDSDHMFVTKDNKSIEFSFDIEYVQGVNDAK